jgi:uncharacterized protein
MSDSFTDVIEPFALARQGRTIEGKVPVANLPRVVPLLRSVDGEVEFSLHFDTDEAGIPRIRGKVNTTLILQCQRCMEDMEYSVSVKTRLGIVASKEAAEHLPANYEPLVVTEEETSIVSLLEDELILALPIVAMHKVEDCPQGDAFTGNAEHEIDAERENTASTGRKNPFAMLAQLKKTLPEDSAD